MTPELHRPVPVARLRPEGEQRTIEAEPAERVRIAVRLGIPAVGALACRFHLTPGRAGEVAAEGELEARVVRTCVVTLEDFETTVTERFALRFVPEGSESAEMDTEPESADEVPYAGGVIDLGEAAVEQLALALDPYPRSPGAMLPGEAQAPDEEQGGRESPFASLARLRRPN